MLRTILLDSSTLRRLDALKTTLNLKYDDLLSLLISEHNEMESKKCQTKKQQKS